METSNKELMIIPQLSKSINDVLKYISLGFSVIPLGLITKDAYGKKVIEYPMGGWKKYQENIVTKEEVLSWKCKNIGIVTGRISNLLVLDTDSYKKNFNEELLKSFNLPITPVQETASGGRQYFFKMPKNILIKNAVCIGTKDSGIDIRGDGGMVIVDPSTTPYGEYKWLVSPFEAPLAELPQKILDLLINESGHELKNKKSLPELIGLNAGEGRNSAMASLIGKLVLTTNNWDNEVWPVAQSINRTYNPPLSSSELKTVYDSITKIEKNRVNKNNIETVEYIPSLIHSELITKDFPPARYTVEPFFEQGTMNMISAPPNNWKSWLIFIFAGHIVNGSKIFSKFATEKTNVMIVNEEDSARSIQDRLKKLNITDPSLSIYYRISRGAKLTEKFVDQLITEAKEKNIGVVMFDSLRAIHDADENNSTEMQKVMDLFKKINREGITVIFTHHNRKKPINGRGDDAESTRGSSAINASISGHISLEEITKDDEKYLLLKHLKSKVCEKILPIDISIQVNEGGISFGYLGEHKPQEKTLTDAKERILNLIQENEALMGRKDFTFLKIGGATTVKIAMKELIKEEKVIQITRSRAINLGLKTFNTGKGNEILYKLQNDEMDELNSQSNEDSDLNMFDDQLLE